MIRTQIYLPEDLKQELELVALREQRPFSEIVRRAVRREVGRRKKRNAGYTLGKIAALATPGGPRDLSSNLFEYLYGEKSGYSKKAMLERAKWYKNYVKQQKARVSK